MIQTGGTAPAAGVAIRARSSFRTAGVVLAIGAIAASSPAAASLFGGCVAKVGGPAVPFHLLPAIGPFPSIELHTLLVAVHLMGFCFGLGGATLLDVWIVRWVWWGRLPGDIVRTFEFVSKSVVCGLVLLWLSGLAFLALYAVGSPEKLGNPKLMAKLLIVLGLTVNGVLLHKQILPRLASAAPFPIFAAEPGWRRQAFVASGVFSGVSWYAAFGLGLFHEFNCRVAAAPIVEAWLLMCGTAIVAACLATTIARRRRHSTGDAWAASRGAIEVPPDLVGWDRPSAVPALPR